MWSHWNTEERAETTMKACKSFDAESEGRESSEYEFNTELRKYE